MNEDELEDRLEELESRIAWQEQIHQKHTPEGNVFHWDFRASDVTRMIRNGIVIGIIAGVGTALIFKMLKPKS